MKGGAIITGRIAKFSGNQVLVSVKQSESGEPLLDIREHYQQDGKWMPMKAGITIGMGRARQIAEAINMAILVSEGRHANAV